MEVGLPGGEGPGVFICSTSALACVDTFVRVWPVRKKMSHSLAEEFCDTASEEDASHELGTFRHGLQCSSRKLFQLTLVLCLMARQLVVLEMVPYFLVRIPVRRIRRQMKYMQTRLPVDPCSCFLGSMRRCPIHDNDEVTAFVVPKHLPKELDHLF